MRHTIEAGSEDRVIVYEGPEPVGTDGLTLYRACAGVIGDLGLQADLQASRIEQAASKLAGHERGLALLVHTFRGWTVDGVKLDRAWVEGLDLERIVEPWQVLLMAWARFGFFGQVFRRALLAEGVEKKEPTAKE